MSERYLAFHELKRLKSIPYTRQHLSKLEKAGLFPRRVQIGPGRVAWKESELDERERNFQRGTLQHRWPAWPNGGSEK